MVCDVILTTIIGIGISAGVYMGITFFRARKGSLGSNNEENIQGENIAFQRSILSEDSN